MKHQPGGPPLAAPVNQALADPQETLVIVFEKLRASRRLAAGQESEARILMFLRGRHFARRPVWRHLAQAVDVKLQRIASAGSDQNRTRSYVGWHVTR